MNSDNHVCALQVTAFDGHWRGEEAIDQRAIVKMNWDEEAGVRAGRAQHWSDRAAVVIDGDAGVEIGGGDGERSL